MIIMCTHSKIFFLTNYASLNIGGIIVEETAVQDIDNETDWKLAEMKYKLLNSNQ